MTAYINTIKGSCNIEEGFPEGALGMTALVVSRYDISTKDLDFIIYKLTC